MDSTASKSLDAELADMVASADNVTANPDSPSELLGWADAASHVGSLVRCLVAQRRLLVDPTFVMPDEFDDAEFDDNLPAMLRAVRARADQAITTGPPAVVGFAALVSSAADIALDLLDEDRT